MSQVPERGGRSDVGGRLRDRQREATRRLYLDAALELVRIEGEAALSMKRLTTELTTSVGAIYRYFPTRVDLLAAVRNERLAALSRGVDRTWEHVEARLASSPTDENVAALGRVVALARFWTEAAESDPDEVDLARRLIAERAAAHRRGETSPSPTHSMIDDVARRLHAAAETKAIEPGDPTPRAALVIEVSTAPVLAASFGTHEDHRDAAATVADHLLERLLTLWGADIDQLEAARALVDALDLFGEKNSWSEP